MRKQTIYIKDLKAKPAKFLGDKVERKHLVQGVGVDFVIEETDIHQAEILLFIEQLDGQRVMHVMSQQDMEELIVVFNGAKRRFNNNKKVSKPKLGLKYFKGIQNKGE